MPAVRGVVQIRPSTRSDITLTLHGRRYLSISVAGCVRELESSHECLSEEEMVTLRVTVWKTAMLASLNASLSLTSSTSAPSAPAPDSGAWRSCVLSTRFSLNFLSKKMDYRSTGILEGVDPEWVMSWQSSGNLRAR
jgi:hypothetical protein